MVMILEGARVGINGISIARENGWDHSKVQSQRKQKIKNLKLERQRFNLPKIRKRVKLTDKTIYPHGSKWLSINCMAKMSNNTKIYDQKASIIRCREKPIKLFHQRFQNNDILNNSPNLITQHTKLQPTTHHQSTLFSSLSPVLGVCLRLKSGPTMAIYQQIRYLILNNKYQFVMTEESTIITKEIGHLKGHSDWVTAIETGHPQKENEDTQVLITASRDRTILIWKFNNESKVTSDFGVPVQSLTGHSHFISDLALTNDNNYLLSSSWDRTLRLWDLRTGKTTQRFSEDGHTKEVLSCAISSDGRYILSSGSDREIKLWNVKGNCKHTVKEYNHNDWVSKVRFIPTSSKTSVGGQYFASIGWDGYLKIWNNQTFNIKDSIRVHDGSINAITVSPRGNFIVTGGKDKKVRVFDFSDVEKPAPSHDAGASVNCLAFNPRCHWIAIGTEVGWQIWDFEAKDTPVIGEGSFKLEGKKSNEEKQSKKTKADKFHQVTSIAWNTLGNRLFVGFSNGDLKVIEVTEEKAN